uniref:Metalloendopeptidase n=1 Tax=Dolopus genitalis TaxID=2488630 RepID=A0A3G5BIG7_DOLGE|nr:venom polypeptide [Dolopus genitalis]
MKYILTIALFAVLFNILLALPIQEANNEDVEVNPEESGDFFEGDMELNEEQMASLLYPDKRNGRIQERYRWPNNIVFYDLGNAFNDAQKAQIEKALRELEKLTCITFKPRTKTTKAYVYLTGEDSGCHSAVGHQNGKQRLNLKPNKPGFGCFKLGTIMHEFIHALGFYHQQSASDRDNYVSIIWENIKDGKGHNFAKQPNTLVTDFGVKYDYGSIMHYSGLAFSKNGKATIVPHDKTAKIGQRDGLSPSDIKKLKAMYKCH